MKKLHPKFKFILYFAFIFCGFNQSVNAQDDTSSVPVVKLRYFNDNNSVQYLLVESSLKKKKQFTPQKNKIYQLYLDSADESLLISKLVTDEKGLAKAVIPTSLKDQWNGKSQHIFILKDGDEEVISDYSITKSRILLDTSSVDSVRTVTATVTKFENGEWIPAADVEMKLGIERLSSILPAGDDPTYTTDSSGVVTLELNKLNLPGDEKGNYNLVARVDDNELYGNLIVKKKVPWGIKTKADTEFFNQRTLWSTRFHTPVWLLAIAYSIVLAVWGTLIYLIIQLFKIYKLGRA